MTCQNIVFYNEFLSQIFMIIIHLLVTSWDEHYRKYLHC
jgi:hypothetical protein